MIKKAKTGNEFWIFSLVGYIFFVIVLWHEEYWLFFLLSFRGNHWKLTNKKEKNKRTFLQSTSEPEAPVENNVSANEVSTTESADEAPKVPPPAVPVEVTVAPALAPVITEDVASVTKVIKQSRLYLHYFSFHPFFYFFFFLTKI